MLNNPNCQHSESPVCASLRRRNSLPTPNVLKATLRRRSTMTTTKFLASQSRQSSARPPPVSSKANNVSEYRPHDVPPCTSTRMLPLPEVVYHCRYGWYSLRVVSTKLNKSNPYVGSFRHSPPTTFRDIRLIQTKFPLGASALPGNSTEPSPSTVFLSCRQTATKPIPATESHSLCQALNLDSYSTRFGYNGRSSPLLLNSNMNVVWPRTRNDTLHNRYSHDNELDVDRRITLQRQKLFLDLVNNNVSQNDENGEHHGGKKSTNKKKRQQQTSFQQTVSKKKQCASTIACVTARDSGSNEHYPNNLNYVTGRLPGGAPEQLGEQGDSAVIESATLRIVSGIASWFFQLDQSLPFTADEHGMTPILRTTNALSTSAKEKTTECDESSLSSSSDDDDDDASSGVTTSTNEDSSYTSYDNYDTFHGSRTVPVDDSIPYFTRSNSNVLSASRLANTVITAPHPGGYMEASCISMLNSTMTEISEKGHHRTDYDTITQMDIVRMARVASRHLDVASIVQLPTITYEKKQVKVVPIADLKVGGEEEDEMTDSIPSDCSIPNGHSQREKSDDEIATRFGPSTAGEFSWMLVHKEKSDTDSGTSSCGGDISSMDSTFSPAQEKTTSSSQPQRGHKSHKCTKPVDALSAVTKKDTSLQDNLQDDQCVICMETFEDGDRLRVLPCKHSFHMGCIDIWLSGSVSMHDCNTAGCPTCKRNANVVDPLSRTIIVEGSISGRGTDVQEQMQRKQDEHDHSRSTNQTASSDYVSSNAYLAESTDGSVPSWAFARLGVAMAKTHL